MPVMGDDESLTHVGRSHHRGIEIALATLGGFAASFLALAFTVTSRSFRSLSGQLLAGNPEANREFPTTLNTMQSAIEGGNPILRSMTSYGWWVAIIILGVLCSLILLKLVRKYV